MTYRIDEHTLVDGVEVSPVVVVTLGDAESVLPQCSLELFRVGHRVDVVRGLFERDQDVRQCRSKSLCDTG